MAKTQAGTARASKTTAPRRTGAAKTAASTKSAAAPKKTGRAKLPKAVMGAVNAARDKKAEDIVVLDLRTAAGFTDYFVIGTGGNSRQISAIADAVRETLKQEFDERPTLTEGVERSEWILLDYFNFVVHIFSRECRSFYGLERLWGAAERIEMEDEVRGRG